MSAGLPPPPPNYGDFPQSSWQPATPPGPPPEKPKGSRSVVWVCGILGVGCLLPIVLTCIGLMFFGFYIETAGPGVSAMEGNKVTPGVRKDLKELKLLGPEDRVIWFYSDGLVSAKEGMYFFTDKDLVLYSQAWQTPEVRIPLADITDLTFTASPGWPDDSMVLVEVKDDEVHTFPLSAEEGKDQVYFEALERAVQRARGGQ
ncbi:hypothetical protein GC173_16645 [bacterium]|nr:hypothetical protein [bacterium]